MCLTQLLGGRLSSCPARLLMTQPAGRRPERSWSSSSRTVALTFVDTFVAIAVEDHSSKEEVLAIVLAGIFLVVFFPRQLKRLVRKKKGHDVDTGCQPRTVNSTGTATLPALASLIGPPLSFLRGVSPFFSSWSVLGW